MPKAKAIKKTKLPDKPSELIRLAVNDLIAVEKSKDYDIDMGEWHRGVTPDDIESAVEGQIEIPKCTVCFAGSVMAKSLKVSKRKLAEPEDFNKDTEKKLYALDDFRTGNILDGLHALEIYDFNQELGDFYIPATVEAEDYSSNPALFKKQMLRLADGLAKAGL